MQNGFRANRPLVQEVRRESVRARPDMHQRSRAPRPQKCEARARQGTANEIMQWRPARTAGHASRRALVLRFRAKKRSSNAGPLLGGVRGLRRPPPHHPPCPLSLLIILLLLPPPPSSFPPCL
eukprot:4631477-Pyramimonas_sp.AAC.1